MTPGRRRVRWLRVSVLAVAAAAAFFLGGEAYRAASAEYGGYVSDLVPTLPTANGESQIPDDVPGFLAGADNADGWYGYDPARYALYVPPVRAGDPRPPLIVCLHGMGDHWVKYRTQGLAPAIRKQVRDGGRFPAAALFPINDPGRWEPGSKGADDMLRVLDRVVERHGFDPARVCLTGWSSGGSGVWALAEAYPERWAAIVPLCAEAGGDPARFRGMPCWAFVGGRDQAVRAEEVVRFTTALRQVGADARCTTYPKVAHSVWGQAYDEPELHEWLARQRRE